MLDSLIVSRILFPSTLYVLLGGNHLSRSTVAGELKRVSACEASNLYRKPPCSCQGLPSPCVTT